MISSRWAAGRSDDEDGMFNAEPRLNDSVGRLSPEKCVGARARAER